MVGGTILPGVINVGAMAGVGGGGRLVPYDSQGYDASNMDKCVRLNARISSAYLEVQPRENLGLAYGANMLYHGGTG